MQQPDLDTMNPPSALPETQQSVPQNHTWLKWSLLCLVGLVIFGGTAVGAFVWLVATPPAPQCQENANLTTARERLSCAQRAAASGDPQRVVEAIELIADWSPTHPLYSESQALSARWSQVLLDRARRQFRENDFDGAVALLEKVPSSSPKYEDAQGTLTYWKERWNLGQKFYDEAQEALKVQDWTLAYRRVKQMSDLENQYWSIERAEALNIQVAQEKQAWRQLKVARSKIRWERVWEYQEAIELAGQVPDGIQTKKVARKQIDEWSQTMLGRATKAKLEQDIPTTLEWVEAIPQQGQAYREGQKLIQLARAQQVVENASSLETPLSERMLALLEAQGIARQLDKDHPLHEDALGRVSQWQTYLQDLGQLQIANSLASVGQSPMLRLAIDQAQAVTPDRPGRIYAQTLVANWRKRVGRMTDAPALNRAQKLAELGTLEGYRAAMEQASAIAMGRPLRNEAQTVVAYSRGRIQTLEDRPILDEAMALAEDGNLAGAIERASQIASGRALYNEAQDSIWSWQAQILLARDRPILDEAIALAADGRYLDAIQTASVIEGNSPLYGEALSEIAGWVAARNRTVRPAAVPALATTPAPKPAPAPDEAIETYVAPPEPVYEPEPYYEPEPVYEPEPYYEPEPVYKEPIAAPEPVYEPEPYYEPAPVYKEPIAPAAPVSPFPKKPLLKN